MALITVMTPVLALLLGAYVADEVLQPRTWFGALLIVVALMVYHQKALALFFKRLLVTLDEKKA